MIEPARRLHGALVGAFSPYVRRGLAEMGHPITQELVEAIDEGERWLDSALATLLAEEFAAQARGPLELVQEAMKFPTDALAAAGVEPIERDEVTALALPGDLFGLAPASSSELGDEAWHAHLAWGAAKAARITRGRHLGIVSANLLDRSKIESAGRARFSSVTSFADVESAEAALAELDLLVVDLAHAGGLELVAGALDAGSRVVAFAPHVRGDLLASADELGAVAVPRSKFFGDLAGHIA